MTLETHDSRLGLAIIANCLTPYRVNLHELIVEGMPELDLHTLISHGAADFQWKIDVHEKINIHHFGRPGDSPLASNWRAPLYEWKKGSRLIAYLIQNDIKAVIINGYRYISYFRVMRYCYRNQIPLFVRNDSNIRSERGMSGPKQLLKACTYRAWMPWVSGWMSMGELGDQFFLKYGAERERLYRVPYTPDYMAFETASPQELQQFRQKYGLVADRKVLVYSGRLAPVKRVDLLIDAFIRLAVERPDWDLLIVGNGILANDLRQRVPEQLRGRVIWTGFLEQRELIDAYHVSDVLVLPSQREAWGVVVQEAMAAGLTVVASDVVGSAHELITDDVSGRIFASADRGSLYRALQDITHPDRLQTYKQRAKAALQQWREANNPISEIRRALYEVGVLPHVIGESNTRRTITPTQYA